ncbi:MAG: hypothetical protein DRO67_00120 [Candidatus Asgardarchaeum californiense]|nr:MAG: hypothetical protein DRO67_00120 [Candidatus Asgardarchaeum californiense]
MNKREKMKQKLLEEKSLTRSREVIEDSLEFLADKKFTKRQLYDMIQQYTNGKPISSIASYYDSSVYIVKHRIDLLKKYGFISNNTSKHRKINPNCKTSYTREECLKLIELRYSGYSYEEIAEELERSISSISNKMFKLRHSKKGKRLIEEYHKNKNSENNKQPIIENTTEPKEENKSGSLSTLIEEMQQKAITSEEGISIKHKEMLIEILHRVI